MTSKIFKIMIDNLINDSDNDQELSDAIRWLDMLAQKKGISFYDIVFDLMNKSDTELRAKNWLNKKLLDQYENTNSNGGVTKNIRQKTQHGKTTSQTSKEKSSWPRPSPIYTKDFEK